MSSFSEDSAVAESFAFEVTVDNPVVVGIDFGISSSGVAIAYRASPQGVKYSAPNAEYDAQDKMEEKVPTVICVEEGGKLFFGHDALERESFLQRIAQEMGEGSGGQLYRNYKAYLKGISSRLEMLVAISTNGHSRRSLMELIAWSLQTLAQHARSAIRNGYGQQSCDNDNIQWVLTVPAIWNDLAKTFMRQAAVRAGLIDNEQSDNLMVVLEPESAALAVHISAPNHNILKTGSRFVVLDCGGANVDISMLQVTAVRPLQIQYIAAPTGGCWGGECVNAQFRRFLKELLGPELGPESGNNAHEFNDIYRQFENAKRQHQPDHPVTIRLIDVLDSKQQLEALAAVWNEKHPDKPIVVSRALRNGILIMSQKLMMSFFEQSTTSILEKVENVLREVRGLRYIILVGGYGRTQVLTERVRNAFHNKDGVRVLVPSGNPNAETAVVHGAVLMGLAKGIIGCRVAKYTYGVEITNPDTREKLFHKLITKGDVLSADHEVVVTLMPVRADQYQITWRLYRSEQVNPIYSAGEYLLGTLTVDCPPRELQAERLHQLRIQFGRSVLRLTSTDVLGNRYVMSFSLE